MPDRRLTGHEPRIQIVYSRTIASFVGLYFATYYTKEKHPHKGWLIESHRVYSTETLAVMYTVALHHTVSGRHTGRALRYMAGCK